MWIGTRRSRFLPSLQKFSPIFKLGKKNFFLEGYVPKIETRALHIQTRQVSYTPSAFKMFYFETANSSGWSGTATQTGLYHQALLAYLLEVKFSTIPSPLLWVQEFTENKCVYLKMQKLSLGGYKEEKEMAPRETPPRGTQWRLPP